MIANILGLDYRDGEGKIEKGEKKLMSLTRE